MTMVMPSKVMNEYRVSFGVDANTSDKYLELCVDFDKMDNMYLLLSGLVKQGIASKITCTTKLAHHFFHMNKACIRLDYGVDVQMLDELIYLTTSERIYVRNRVFN